MWDFGKFSNNVAVITESGERVSYSALAEYCSSLTCHIPHRCLVFNLCRNELGSLVGYVACLNAKVIPLMLKADLDESLLLDLVKAYKPDYLHVPAEMAAHPRKRLIPIVW